MSRVRSLLASLALASSLVGCAVPHANATSFKPLPGQVAPDVAPAPIRIMPIAPEVTRAQVRAKLAERRKLTMKRFLAYREARVYPVNASISGFGHVWLDERGNLCAAATLIAGDWGRDASANIARENNQIKLADVTDGAIYDWMLTSGMTKAELVSIQVPGWQDGRLEQMREQEIQRLYALYVDVERQIKSLDKHNLDLAVDELMKHPDLARDLVAGKSAGPGEYSDPSGIEKPRVDPSEPVAPPVEPTVGFAKPPK